MPADLCQHHRLEREHRHDRKPLPDHRSRGRSRAPPVIPFSSAEAATRLSSHRVAQAPPMPADHDQELPRRIPDHRRLRSSVGGQTAADQNPRSEPPHDRGLPDLQPHDVDQLPHSARHPRQRALDWHRDPQLRDPQHPQQRRQWQCPRDPRGGHESSPISDLVIRGNELRDLVPGQLRDPRP